MESISFEEFPSSVSSLTQLYRTYISQYNQIAKFYNGNFRELDRQSPLIEEIKSRYRNRVRTASVLEDQQRRMGMGKPSADNAASLQHENTFAVVTGQQVGFLGGPLYTLYKIITTVKLAEKLNREFKEFSFVPVFYLEAEDHDFAEMSIVHFLNSSNEFQSAQYLPNGKPVEKNTGPVGSLVFDGTLQETINTVYENLTPSEFRDTVFEQIRASYKQGNDFAAAFTQYINALFPNSGLVIVDPRDKDLKQILKPIFSRELETHPRTSEMVIRRSAVLEEHYHAQAKPKAINLFLLWRGGRFLIEPRDDGFGLKGNRQRFTRDELTGLIDQSPELFSPNVLLRPICQDFLLPTFVYVGGPSEIAYFAQLKEVYAHFDVPMPVVYPRISGTIIEEKVNRTLKKFDLSPFDFFTDTDMLQKNITSKLSDVKVDELFGKTLEHFEEYLKELRYGLQSIDPTLGSGFDTARSKIEYQLNNLKEKAFNAQRRNHANALHQIEKSVLHIVPNGMLQERVFSAFQFATRYGPDFVKWLQDQVKLENFDHQFYYR